MLSGCFYLLVVYYSNYDVLGSLSKSPATVLYFCKVNKEPSLILLVICANLAALLSSSLLFSHAVNTTLFSNNLSAPVLHFTF